MSKLLLIEDESKHNNLAAFGVKFCTINSLSVNIYISKTATARQKYCQSRSNKGGMKYGYVLITFEGRRSYADTQKIRKSERYT